MNLATQELALQRIQMSLALRTMDVVDERHGASMIMADRYSVPVEER
jgi:hypothetical protein